MVRGLPRGTKGKSYTPVRLGSARKEYDPDVSEFERTRRFWENLSAPNLDFRKFSGSRRQMTSCPDPEEHDIFHEIGGFISDKLAEYQLPDTKENSTAQDVVAVVKHLENEAKRWERAYNLQVLETQLLKEQILGQKALLEDKDESARLVAQTAVQREATLRSELRTEIEELKAQKEALNESLEQVRERLKYEEEKEPAPLPEGLTGPLVSKGNQSSARQVELDLDLLLDIVKTPHTLPEIWAKKTGVALTEHELDLWEKAESPLIDPDEA